MKPIITISIFILFTYYLHSQTHHVFHIGHSLVNPDMPAMLHSIAKDDPSVTHDYNIGLINGAPLFWIWDNVFDCQGYQASYIDAKEELESGDYDIFVMTEGVPWDPILEDFFAYSDSFHTLALEGNPNIQTYLYETWNCINTGLTDGCMYDEGDTILWKDRILEDHSTWVDVTNNLSNNHPDHKPVYIVPVGRAMANLKDSVDAGVVPGITNFFDDIFEDDIHNTDLGKYFVACVHYATIYKKSPVGLTQHTTSEWGEAYEAPSSATARKLQEIAWISVCSNPNSGVDDCGTINVHDQNNVLKIGHRHTTYQLMINNLLPDSKITIYNTLGEKYYGFSTSSENLTIPIHQLQSGYYFTVIQHQNSFQTFKWVKY